ncbi:MaoC family dehydratase [Brooklawnia cerclae]|uniref:Acyl dehydratase n=1 Tax=Brooklawnia cerclae TaxID=349934 RepID=A0ABX0SBP9_9ACTN|nr:MaoC/PaaZ C-terminal domain-containing protein [Brooklawnia cerclae]NIH55813.1 acyl dehydratase [Brooklawnia cerclae]
MKPSDISVGIELPPLDLHLTRSDVVRYAGASTDFNPIHHSDRMARALGLPGVVVHGMWTMGAALRIVTDWVGDPALVTSYFARFTAPVAVPDDDTGTTVQVRARVVAVSDGVATIALEADHDGHKVLGAARAEVRLP